jgi:replicative DNA helicase
MNTDPQSHISEEAEEAVLGACLLDQDAALEAVSRLEESDFSGGRMTIFQAVQTLVADGLPVDQLTISNHLKANKTLTAIGGASYLAALTDRLPDVANIGYYCAIIIEHTKVREIKRIGQYILNNELESRELLEETLNRLYNVREGGEDREPKQIKKVAAEVVADSLMLAQGHLDEVGLRTIPALDEVITVGPGKNIVLAGGPSTGKTSLALQIADVVAERGKSVLVFSLEMMADQLATRLLARRTAAHFDAISKGRVEPYFQKRLEDELLQIDNMPLWICDDPDLTSTDIRALARKHQLRHGLDLVIVDYLQLVTPPPGLRGRSRENEVSACSRGLKKLSMALPVPCFTLSQLNRKGQGEDHRPALHELRESGSIENDADIVIFIYRPDIQSPAAQLLIAKNRNGPVGEVDMIFRGARYSFEEPISHEREAPPRSLGY